MNDMKTYINKIVYYQNKPKDHGKDTSTFKKIQYGWFELSNRNLNSHKPMIVAVYYHLANTLSQFRGSQPEVTKSY